VTKLAVLSKNCNERLNPNQTITKHRKITGNETMDITVELGKLQGKRLLTLYQKKPFEITQVCSDQIILKTTKESQRPIPLKEIKRAWKHLQKHKKLTNSEVRDLGYSDSDPAYVVAILASLPGVTHSLTPIVLKLQ